MSHRAGALFLDVAMVLCVLFLVTCALPPAPEPIPDDSITYPFSSIVCTVGVALPDYDPEVFAYEPVSFKVIPQLPQGIKFDTTTGRISGTPEIASPETPYIVEIVGLSKPVSTVVRITVVSRAATESDSAPIFTLNLSERQQVLVGGTLTLSVTVKGAPTPSLQWFRNDTLVQGPSAQQYAIPSVQHSDNGALFYCVATNRAGTVKSTVCTLLVTQSIAKPAIVSLLPSRAQKLEGDSVSFVVNATGTQPLTYLWRKGSEVRTPPDPTRMVLSNLALQDSGIYRVVVKNIYGDSAVGVCTLSVDQKFHDIAIRIRGSGTTSPAPVNGSVRVRHNSSQSFSFTPLPGNRLDSVYVNGAHTPTAVTAMQYTFASVVSSCSLSVVFTKQKYKLTLQSDSGTVSVTPNASTYEYGDTAVLVAAPNAGFYFAGFTGDTLATAPTLRIVFTKDRSITANFVRIGSLALTTTALNGRVIKAPDNASYQYGTVVQLTAIPDSGYSFVSWSDSLSGTSNPASITMTSSKQVTAVFARQTYQLTINAGTGTRVKPATSPAVAVHGTSLEIEVAPPIGHTFSGWVVTSGSAVVADPSAKATTVILTGNATLTANYAVKRFSLVTSTSADVGTVTGNVLRNPEATMYDSNAVVILTAPSDPRYTLTGWSGGATATSTLGEAQVVMNGNKSIVAQYAIKKYTITLNRQPTAGGNVTATPATGPYNHGTTVMLTAQPNTGYSFAGWSGDASGTGSVPLLMDANKTVTATFSINAPVITNQPVGKTVTAGQPESLWVGASGVGLSYQWQKNGVNITGATSATLKMLVVKEGDQGEYRCVVANTAGNANSNSVTLNVNPRGMRLLSAGQFIRTTDGRTSTIALSSFWIDTTEVTQQSFNTLMGFNPSTQTINGVYPVNNVTWFDAALYCNAKSKASGLDTFYVYTNRLMSGNHCIELLGLSMKYTVRAFRLPSDAQWEYACRAGTYTKFWWGNDTVGMGARAWAYSYPHSGTIGPVATKIPNAWGLYDMVGNVMEMCNDWYPMTNPTGDQTDPEGPATGEARISRGGSALITGDEVLAPYIYYSSAERFSNWMDADSIRRQYNGLRCVIRR